MEKFDEKNFNTRLFGEERRAVVILLYNIKISSKSGAA